MRNLLGYKEPLIKYLGFFPLLTNTRFKVRLLRALECGLANEVEWALDELLRISTNASDQIFYFYSVPGIPSVLLELFYHQLTTESEGCCGLKKILVVLWNCCCENGRNTQFLVINEKALVAEVMAEGMKQGHRFILLGILQLWVNWIECLCSEPAFVIAEEVAAPLETFLKQCLASPDRVLRLAALSLMKTTFGNNPNTQLSLELFERSLGQLVLQNAIIQDDLIQNAAVDYLFNLSDALETLGTGSSFGFHILSKDSFSQLINILFHIIFDNFSFAKHFKNISYKSLLKNVHMSTSQLLSKWVLLCYVPANLGDSPISMHDIYRQFEMFCAREGIPDGPLDFVVFANKVSQLYPKCIAPAVAPGTVVYASLRARNWNERPVKTTEKVVNAILTLRNFATLPVDAAQIEAAFAPHWESLSQLAVQPDANANFIAKHFGLILCELFCREIFFA